MHCSSACLSVWIPSRKSSHDRWLTVGTCCARAVPACDVTTILQMLDSCENRRWHNQQVSFHFAAWIHPRTKQACQNDHIILPRKELQRFSGLQCSQPTNSDHHSMKVHLRVANFLPKRRNDNRKGHNHRQKQPPPTMGDNNQPKPSPQTKSKLEGCL